MRDTITGVRGPYLLFISVVFIAACATSAPPPVAAVRAPGVARMPREIALAVAHVPPEFVLIDDRERTLDSFAVESADPATEIAALVAHGYVSGWYREYRKDAELGLVQVSSNCGAYASVDGAKWAFAANVQETSRSEPPAAVVALGEVIGDESVGYELVGAGPDDTTTFTAYFIYFRFRNISNTVTAAGIGPGVDIRTAIALAKQQLANQR